MTPEIERAIEEIKEVFPEHRVEVIPESQGGAYIFVHDLSLGEHYVPSKGWVGFQITFQYPHADIYPHFVDGNLRRKDGLGFAQGLSGPSNWQGRSVIQISRRSKRWNPAVDTAATKLTKVLSWLENQ